MADNNVIATAKEHFGGLVQEQLERVERLKQAPAPIDYSKVNPIIIGMLGGDGIGPTITYESQRVLEQLLEGEVKSGKVQFRNIDGLTIENRAAKLQSIPDDVLAEIKECHVHPQGPDATRLRRATAGRTSRARTSPCARRWTSSPTSGPSAFPAENIDWTFFRENTEDMYALGSNGINITEDLAMDFRVITTQGSRRIIDAAFAHAKKTGKERVTIVTKANIVKTTDGKFLDVAREVAENYPGISWDAWYIDIMTAKLLDTARRSDFQVLALPNMYGDILTDEAAQIQGGVGTAGSANIGTTSAMFEAIHGSAPRMVTEGRAQYADPSSMVRAGAMLLEHIGFSELGEKVNMALDVCGQYERKAVTTGRDTGATTGEFGNYIVDTVSDSGLKSKWEGYVFAN